jgi:DNA-binding CsgD family transcriptional regulator
MKEDIDNEDITFILNKCPIGLIIFDRKTNILYRNKRAGSILNSFELPPEIPTINKRIFEAVNRGRLNELFPGDIYLTKKFDGSPSNWIFRFYVYEKTDPLIYVVIMEETISNKLDMNEIRQEFRLTRRETDIVRRVVDGLRNIEIAEEVDISEQTVKDHLSNIYMKIGVENRLALMRKLMQTSNIQKE